MKRFVFFALMMVFVNAASSQSLKEYFDESFVLDAVLPGDTSYHYTASDNILMIDSFLYSPRMRNFGRFDIGEGKPQPVNHPGFGHNNGMGYGGAFSNSGMVGTIPYDFSVSETGAAVITVPLELPSGPNGIKPDLAFVYNSQGGDGIMGVRWSLGGMSKISRTPYTYEFNDYSAAITFSDDDQFSLDGMMLIKDDSGNGVRYYPEVIDGSYITVSNDGFKKHAANGWIYEYYAKYYLQNYTGPNDDDNPIEWHLSRAVDPFGNEIVYTYSNDVAEGSFLPRKIEYGHKVDGRYPYTVKFYYYYPEDTGNQPWRYPYGWWNVDNGRPDTQKKYFSDRKENGTVGCFSRITQTLAMVKIISNAIEIPVTNPGMLQNGDSTLVRNFSNHCYKLDYMMEGDLKKPHLSLIEEGICTHDEDKVEEAGRDFPSNQREPLYFSWKTDSLSLQRQVPFVQESDSLFSMEKYYDDDTDWAQECMLGGHFSEKYTNDFIYVIKMKSTNEYYVKAFRNMSGNPAYCWSDGGYNVSEINDFLMGKNNLVKKFDICDTDADGIDEFMVVYLNTQSAQNCSVVIFKPNPNANGKFELNLLDNVPIPPDAASSLQVADFNGDQISDLMYLNPNTNGTKTVTFRISWAGYVFHEVVYGGSINNDNKIVLGDFDGDKHTSVLIISENQSEVHSEILRIIPNQGNGQERHQVQTFDLGNGLFPGYWDNHEFSSKIIAGDYNGDGKTDILDVDVFPLEEENWNFFFSKGNGLFEIMKRKDREFDKFDYLYPVDLNNDGCCDICCIAKNRKKIDEYYYQFEWYRFDYMIRPDYEKVNVFSESLTETTISYDSLGIAHILTYAKPFETYQADSLKSYFGNWAATIGTFNGLSNNQVFFCRPQIHNGNFKLKTVLTYYPENKTRHVIDKIVDGFGVSRIINYTPVACQDLSVFGRDAGEGKNAPDPIHLYRGNLDVVKQVKYESELDNFDDVVTDYYFKNARYDTHGRGFIGFDESLIEERSGKSIRKYYTYDNVRHFMVPEKTTLSAVDESIVETYEYGFKNLSGHFPTKCFKPFQRNVRKKYYKNGSNYKTETDMISADDFDEWGNVLKTTRQYSGDGGQVVTHRKYRNFSNGDQRFLGLVTSDSVQYALVPGETPIVKCVNYEYNNKGRVTKKTLEKDAPNRTEETYTYDSFGNMTSKTVASQGITKTESMTYCPKGIFMLSKTDAMGHTTTYTYHKIRCLLATETDPNGLTTSYHYNTIGELDQVIRPDGTEQRMGKRWINDYIIPDYEINYYSHPDCPDSVRVAYYSWSQESNGPMLYSFYDHHQNKLRDVTVNNAGDYADDDETYVDYEYDYTTEKRIHEGFLSKKSVPYLHPYIPPEDPYMHRHDSMPPPPEPEAPDLRHWYHYRYDNMDRLTLTTRDDGYSSANHIYNGLCENMQGFDGQQKLAFYLPNGLLDSVVDNYGSYMKYRYYADGNVKSVTINGDASTTVSYTYDNYGNLAMMIDPALDTVVYRYNAFGDLLHYTDSKGTTDYEYDLLGRMTHRRNAELETDWKWDAENAIGQLKSTYQTNFNGTVSQVEETFKYDEYGRMKEHAQAIDGGEPLAFKYAYNANGKLKSTTYPSGLKLVNTYDTYGTLVKIKHNGKPIWEAKKFNAYGTLDEYKTNNDIVVQQTFDTITGDLTSIIAKTSDQCVFDQYYSWNPRNGNLTSRSDRMTNVSERFGYDAFNRLDTIVTKKNNSVVNRFYLAYDASGNITEKGGVGSYGYAEDGNPYSINTLSNVANPDDFAEDQLATYTTFNKLATLEQGDKRLRIAYGPDDQRVWQQVITPEHDRQKRYFTQLYETVSEDGVTKNLHYLYAPSGLFAIFATSDNTETMHYTFTDHQGSLAAYTGNAKEPVTRLSYDAWGRRRNAADGSYDSVSAAFDRGYTGHEHLDAFGLINMNGRLYDPMLGRMLSPDIVVQQTDYTQSYNRYSYCFNNPLRFTDPTGWVTEDGWYRDFRGTLKYDARVHSQKDMYSLGILGKFENDEGWRPTPPDMGTFNTEATEGNSQPWIIGYYVDPIVVDDNKSAVKHYLYGDGTPVKLGHKTTDAVLNNSEFQERHTQIVEGEYSKQSFSVDLEGEMFHVGHTNIEYEILKDEQRIKYTLFVNDGFWDPDFIDEKFMKSQMPWCKPDGMGPNLERFGGTPYQYIPTSISLPFNFYQDHEK